METLLHSFMLFCNIIAILAMIGATALLVEIRSTFVNMRRSFGQGVAQSWLDLQTWKLFGIVAVLTLAVIDLLVW